MLQENFQDRTDFMIVGRASKPSLSYFILSIIAKNYFMQISLGLLIVILVPFLLKSLVFEIDVFSRIQVTSLMGSAISFLVGAIVFMRIIRFPGVNRYAYVLPIFFLVFILFIIILLFGRFSFSRYQILISWFLSIGWGFAVAWLSTTFARPTFGIIPFGDIDGLFHLGRVNWRILEDPDQGLSDIDALAADFRSEMPEDWKQLLVQTTLRRVPVYHKRYIEERFTGRVEIDHLSENTFGWLLPPQSYERVKRLLDILGVMFTAPFIIPVILVLGIIIKLESPGPVFFRQMRLGSGGQPFEMFKLRTMREETEGPAFTEKNDSRVTPIGRVLRKYRIDELPQAINILRGEMSWIGPRPESLELSALYVSEIPYYKYRYIVRPGISGWAQVMQGAGTGVEEVTEKLKYDFYYVKNFSPWLDFLILFKTIQTVFTGFGSR
jgi:lipopolysaccharide/colanic/teichoic acid biosynthesis glycosyltransferase